MEEIIHHLEEFFKITSQRKNNTYCLDITGHFISSLNNLINF